MASITPTNTLEEQSAAIRQLLGQYNAPMTAENFNRASQHIANAGMTGPLLFDQAMERAVGNPTGRQATQARAARNATPSVADGGQYAGGAAMPMATGGVPGTASSPPTGGVVVPETGEVPLPNPTEGAVAMPAPHNGSMVALVAPPGGVRIGPATANASPAGAGEPTAGTALPPTGDPIADAMNAAPQDDGTGAAGILPYLAAIMARRRIPTVGTPPPTGGANALPSAANTTVLPPVDAAGAPRIGSGLPTGALPAPRVPTAADAPAVIPQPGIINMPTPPGGTNADLQRRFAEYDNPPMQTSRTPAATSEQKPAPVSRPRRNANPKLRETDTAPSVDPVVSEVAKRRRRRASQ